MLVVKVKSCFVKEQKVLARRQCYKRLPKKGAAGCHNNHFA